MRALLAEIVVVAVVAVAFGLAANALSPRGLELRRDYFPEPEPPAEAPDEPEEGDAVARRLAERGLQALSHADAVAAFEDELYDYGLHVFVDARDDAHYEEGHVPGAWQLDYYRPEAYADEVLSAVQGAMMVVVYCNGGTCEDSELAAHWLMAQGVDPARVHVYTGGIAAWREAGMPVERGARGSGDVAVDE